MPISRSSVANRPAKAAVSSRSPLSRSTPGRWSMHSFAAARASAGPPTNCRAQAERGRAAPRSAGTTWSASPMRSASAAADEATGEDQLLGPGGTDQPGQPLGAAGAGDDPQLDLRLAEGGVVGGDPDVGAQRQLAATAEGVAVDRGDHRLGDRGHRPERVLQHGRRAGSCRRAPMAAISLMSAPAANTCSTTGDHHGGDVGRAPPPPSPARRSAAAWPRRGRSSSAGRAGARRPRPATSSRTVDPRRTDFGASLMTRTLRRVGPDRTSESAEIVSTKRADLERFKAQWSRPFAPTGFARAEVAECPRRVDRRSPPGRRGRR